MIVAAWGNDDHVRNRMQCSLSGARHSKSYIDLFNGFDDVVDLNSVAVPPLGNDVAFVSTARP